MFENITKSIEKLFGNKSKRDVKALQGKVDEINKLYDKLTNISHDELRSKSFALKQKIKDHLAEVEKQLEDYKKQASTEEDVHEKERIYENIDKLEKKRDEQTEEILNTILPEAFAIMKETARRFKENETLEVTPTDLDKELAVNKDYIEIEGDKAIYHNSWEAAGNMMTWDMVHYDVQLIGGMVLHQGKIAEMATGEGKTLVATLPAYLNGLTGFGVHIVTVNDYLARRDAEWMGPLFEFLGLTVNCIDNYRPHSEERKKAYRSSIVYGTNNEFGFDYLRDNMSFTPDELVQHKLHFAMVDEVDSVLIDDARTPLIISGPVQKNTEQEYYQLRPRIEKLFNVQKKLVTSFLNDAKKLLAEGKTEDGGMALLRAYRGLPKNKPLIKYLSEDGIKTILQKTENRYLQDQAKDMPLVDKELYFVINEKNNLVELTEKGIDLLTGEGEDKNFFVMPDLGVEMAEIEKADMDGEEKAKRKDQVLNDYSEKSERIHTVQQLLKAYALFEKDVEYVVMDSKVKIVDENTGRIMEGRRYSDGLHQAIEAKENVKVEAPSQTHATVTLQNFFRMYHKLSGMTGTAETEAGEFWEIYKLDVVVIPTNLPIIRDDKEDLVYKTMREKFNAIIEEVVKLSDAGRPVLVGTTSVEVSEVLSRMLKMRNITHNVLNAKQHQREAEVVAEAGKAGAVTIATNMAGRGTDIKLGPGVKDAGGLAIVGTERHDSRRIDRQLSGRAGRQGDPGTSQFFVSLEDNLMRLFGSERIAKIMDRLGYQEGEVLTHSMITKSIVRAQKKIEENNFGARKNLLEYDNVMNIQREVIYKKRRHALFGERLSVDIDHSFYDVCQDMVDQYQTESNPDGLRTELIRLFSFETKIDDESFRKDGVQNNVEKLYQEIVSHYKDKSDAIAKMAYPVIKNVYETRGDAVENIVIPFTDGRKGVHVHANLKNAYETEGKSIIRDFEKSISLAFIDETWKDHLRMMDELKESVQQARFEQKDPLIIYKFEAYKLFEGMVKRLNKDIISFIFKGKIQTQEPQDIREAEDLPKQQNKQMKESRNDSVLAGGAPKPGGDGAVAQQQAPSRPEPVRVGEKIGRNDPCPCGSGKKYKHCHGS